MMYYLFSVILGFISGSFVTMASYRIPNDISLKGRSSCPKCNKKLKFLDLIPLFSYLKQNGKCRYCKTEISLRYPLIELTNGLLYLLNAFIIEDIILLTIVCIVSTILLIITVSDLEHFIIPDQMVLLLAALGIIFAYIKNFPLIQVITLPLAMIIISYLLKRSSKVFFGKEALGMGDVKFFAASGFYLEVEILANFFLIAGISALFFGLIWRFKGKGNYFPFGPALCCSLYLCILFPNHLNKILLG